MYNSITLPNGLRFIAAPMPGAKTATILVIVKTGSKYEDAKTSGLSHFLEHMFFKGTKKRPTALSISAELDSLGGEFNAFTGKEYTGFWVKAEASKIELATEIISDMLLNSKFDGKEIAKEKGVIVEELNMYQDNPMAYIEDLFENLLYGNTPAGWDTIGNKKNINGFKRSDFVSYLKTQYGAKKIVICLAGNIPEGAGKSEKLIKKYFSAFGETKFKEKEKVIESQTKPQILFHHKKTDQTHIALGVRAYHSGHKDEMTLKIISALLGGSMGSRLFIELREKLGLAYYVRAMAELYTDSGYLVAQAGVHSEKAEEAIKVILREYKKLKNVLVGKEELDRIKDLFKGRLLMQSETSDDVAEWCAKQMIMKDKTITPEEYLKIVRAIKPEDIRRVAREIFVSERLNLAVIGAKPLAISEGQLLI
jgi:predicted Zn-dependent peptidase